MTEGRVNTATHCRYCRTELTYDEETNCKRCPTCHPPSKAVVAPPQKTKGYLDVKMTEAMVREIVRDELENWHIRKPPMTAAEAHKVIQQINSNPVDNMPPPVTKPEPPNWRQQAKELGIPLYHKKKEDVIKEIEARMSGSNNVPTDEGQ